MAVDMLLRGVLLGLAAAVPIGPINVEIARRTLRHGFKGGCLLGCGAVTVDVCCALLTSLSLRPVLAIQSAKVAIGVVGSLLLAYLGTMSIRAAARGSDTDLLGDAPPPVSGRSHYALGLLMTALNPFTLLFWFVAVPGLVGPLTDHPARDLPMLCAGVAIGAVSWVLFFAGLLAYAGRWRKPWLTTAADATGGVLLILFAVLTLWRTLT